VRDFDCIIGDGLLTVADSFAEGWSVLRDRVL